MGTKTQKLSNVVDQIVEWQSVFTGDGSTGLTAVAGRGYFIDTTSGTVTVTLPASPKAGDIVQLKDYARTWNTNNVTTSSALTDGNSKITTFSTNGQTVTLVYMDGTKGWSLINEDTTSNLGAAYIAATGGTILTSGDFKTHIFTGDGCFVVSCAGNPGGSTTVEYLVVAGGGGGGISNGGGGGGGAGGYRQNYPSPVTGGLCVSAQTYPVTVSAGGAGGVGGCAGNRGTSGSNSVFSTITSTGGGGGGGKNNSPTCSPGLPGGSGGGGGRSPSSSGGSGNTPPVSPPQGNNGGNGSPCGQNTGGGGGGAGGAGSNYTPGSGGGNGGIGSPLETTFFGPTAPSYGTSGPAPGRYFAGGGGGNEEVGPNPAGSGGAGGGGAGYCGGSGTGEAGTANTGGGGGGGDYPGNAGGAGGKGIIAIRYKFQ